MTQIPGPKICVCVCVSLGSGGVVETWPEQLCFLKVAFIVTVAAVGTEGPSWGTVRKDAGGESAAAPGRAGSLVCICASLPCDNIPVHSPCW